MSLNVEDIRSKLSRLRAVDQSHEVFGADSHRYKLNPPISEDNLENFETSHKVRLPDDFRHFLLEVGNGGAGPHYGIFPLGVFPDKCRCGDLSRPFLHTKPWNVPNEWFSAIPSPWGDKEAELAQQSWPSQKALREALFALPKDEDALRTRKEMLAWYFNPMHINGALPICHEGCGYYDLLILNGPEAGNIWIDARVSDGGIVPWGGPDGPREYFSVWYTNWLVRSLQESKSEE